MRLFVARGKSLIDQISREKSRTIHACVYMCCVRAQHNIVLKRFLIAVPWVFRLFAEKKKIIHFNYFPREAHCAAIRIKNK
jgi:hypothetical protein